MSNDTTLPVEPFNIAMAITDFVTDHSSTFIDLTAQPPVIEIRFTTPESEAKIIYSNWNAFQYAAWHPEYRITASGELSESEYEDIYNRHMDVDQFVAWLNLKWSSKS